MTDTKIALLPDRGVVSIEGDDAERLLQGFLTNDMQLLASQPAIHAAFCSPQGKILFDLFVVKTPTGFCLETGRDQTAALVDRINHFKLRAKAEAKDVSSDYTVAAIWGGPYEPHGRGKQPLWFADPRLPDMGYRELVTIGSDWALAGEEADSATPGDYHAHRIALGVPEGGKDYTLGDTYPHEALLDQLNGVSFKKGCFVGQEVVARMQHRGTTRKRVVPIIAKGDELPAPGTEVTAGSIEIGKLGSVSDGRGLALLRLDRAVELGEKGETLSAGTVPVAIEIPSWASFSLEAKAASPQV
jgi:tRNA-modifying protein YgfZ